MEEVRKEQQIEMLCILNLIITLGKTKLYVLSYGLSRTDWQTSAACNAK